MYLIVIFFNMFQKLFVITIALILSRKVSAQYQITRVIEGTPTSIDRYPIVAQLLLDSWGDQHYVQHCAGVIVTARHVISTAHCFQYNSNTGRNYALPKYWKIRVGSSYRTYGGVVHNLKSIIPHNGFDSHYYTNDIAVVVVSKPFTFNNNVRQSTIIKQNVEIKPNSLCILIGWGVLETFERYYDRYLSKGIIRMRHKLMSSPLWVSHDYSMGFFKKDVKRFLQSFQRSSSLELIQASIDYSNYLRSESYDHRQPELDGPMAIRPSQGESPLIKTSSTQSPSEQSSASIVTGRDYKVGGSQPDQLQHTTMFTIDQNICRSRYNSIGAMIANSMLCAGRIDLGGPDGCYGDSGGPLIYKGLVVGLVSYGYSCGHRYYPGVYTKISHFTDWILNTVYTNK